MAGTVVKLLVLLSLVFPELIAGQLRLNYYAGICPDVENVVRSAVFEKFSQTAITVPAVIRLFFHDCIVNGCDGSVLIASTAGNTAEKDHPDNLSLAGDGFDTVLKAKEAVDSVPGCRNRVSCADILALAARDAVFLGGGPWYPVELGRLDALSSTASSVDGNLPEPSFNLDQLNAMFADRGLSQADMIALSGAHTVGFAHCSRFSSRIYNFTAESPVDPTLDQKYALQLQNTCPLNPDSRVVAELDPTTPRAFDNLYFQNLVAGRGLLSSDQVLYTDPRSRGLVEQWASDPIGFNMAFVQAITKLGRIGVKNGANGNIRFDCSRFN